MLNEKKTLLQTVLRIAILSIAVFLIILIVFGFIYFIPKIINTFSNLQQNIQQGITDMFSRKTNTRSKVATSTEATSTQTTSTTTPTTKETSTTTISKPASLSTPTSSPTPSPAPTIYANTNPVDIIFTNIQTGVVNRQTGIFTERNYYYKGERLAVRIQVKNTGGTATSLWSFKTWINNDIENAILSGTLPSIISNQTQTYVLGIDIPSDTYSENTTKITVTLDNKNLVRESNEQNNTTSVLMNQY